ncbi:tRNA pseudouridine(38-40) synthase TruA [Spirosoma pollinicola]|uniref:tRNA pseudouridine synthase A n=1 Tax=Spirosoma pollinicola TaxID=2057025 RepID=A0A2K8YSU3_9BACT|nr:tRNA pseudouridine(38-40) synthase TruA [Spirosoma pollinicola]AUD00658.1 tRNA pseudouridine(38-40) synthase TruA [Spirosoma pollinicola]
MRYFIELSYRGTAYHGWQTQANGVSVQITLEAALTQRLGKPIYIMGSGRTDAGVHAKQQFAHFDVEEPLNLTEAFIYSINCILPEDIAIHAIFPVQPNDHARFSANSRYYQYHVTRQKNAFQSSLTYHFRPHLDIERMNAACAILLQHTNFQSFSKARANVTHFHCRLDFAYWQHTNADCLTFHIKANRFLWGMVRTIVGTMLEIGQGRMSLEQFEQIILARDRTIAGRAAPANGLYLVDVGYPAEVLAQRQKE